MVTRPRFYARLSGALVPGDRVAALRARPPNGAAAAALEEESLIIGFALLPPSLQKE